MDYELSKGIMIQGRIPEITIKFSEKPDLPTEGKKVALEIQGENVAKFQFEGFE